MKILKSNFKLLFALGLSTLIMACNNGVKPISEGPLQLDNFDFETPFATLITEKDRSEKYPGNYELKGEVLRVDTVGEEDFDGNVILPNWITYRKQTSSGKDVLVKFGDFKFSAINFVTTLDQRFMLMSGVDGKVSKREVEKFIKMVTTKYGAVEQTKGGSTVPTDIYTWELPDRVIKYVVVPTDKNSNLEIDLTDGDKAAETGKKSRFMATYLFVISKPFAGALIGQLTTGDLSYCE